MSRFGEVKRVSKQLETLQQAFISDTTPSEIKESFAIQISVLQEQYNELTQRISLKEKMARENGRFYIEIPTAYKKKMYAKLFDNNIKPRLSTLDDKTKVIVDTIPKLNKVYSIYADILTKDSQPVPDMDSIKGTLSKR